MRQRVRADVTLRRGGQQCTRHLAGPAVPAGRHPHATVAESRSVRVRVRWSHRDRRHPREADVQRVAARHARGGPAGRIRLKQPGGDGEQPRPVGGRRRDQDVRAGPGARAVLLGAVQLPDAVPPGRLHVRTGRVRRPHTPAAAGSGRGPPSSARIATASACPSASLARDRSSPARSANAAHRSLVAPEPGSGRFSLPDSTAAANAAALRCQAACPSSPSSPPCR